MLLYCLKFGWRTKGFKFTYPLFLFDYLGGYFLPFKATRIDAQMMKLGEARAIPIKTGEQIIKIKAA